MKTTGIKQNLVFSTLYQILNIIVPLVTAPYVARVLGADGVGIYSYTHAYSMYFTLIGALGTITYGTREIARNRNDRKLRSILFWEIALLTIVTSTASLIVWGIWTACNSRYQVYYLILSLTLLGTMFDISWFFAGMEEFKYTITHNSFFKILSTAAIFLFVNKPSDLWKYTLILSTAAFFSSISMWIYLPRYVDTVQVHTLNLKKHFKETFVYFVPTIATSIYTILDKTLIGLITEDTSENGNYEQATKIINIAKTVCFTGVNAVFQSRISYLFSEEKYEEIKYRIAASMDYILFAGCGLCFGIIGISRRFVPFFFGSGYSLTSDLLIFLAPLVVIIGISNCLGSQFYNPAGLRAKSAKYIIIGSFVNLVCNLILIPAFRSRGAAIATIFAELIITALYIKNCDEYYSSRLLRKQVSKKIVSGIIMMVCVYGTGGFIQNDYLAIAAQIIIGVMIYVLVLTFLNDTIIKDFLVPQLRNLGKKIGK